MTQNAINTNIPIEIIYGGTESTTLTDHGVLVGSGTSPITALSVGATNTVLQGSTGADPSFTDTPQVTSISFGQTALANYHENTWTPVLAFGGGSTGISYNTQTGNYIRFGRIRFLSFSIFLSSKGSDVGNATISGFPTSTVGFKGLLQRWNFITLGAGYTFLTAEYTASGSSLTIIKNGDNVGGTAITDADFANNTQLRGNFWYYA